jgi:hypothetical protein
VCAEQRVDRILNELGVQLNPQKTRIVHVRQGFEFPGYKVKRGKQLQLPPGKIRSGAQSGGYTIPREKSVNLVLDEFESAAAILLKHKLVIR